MTQQGDAVNETDRHFMALAMDEARRAEAAGDVPVGCVLVHDGKVIGRGHNRREAAQDPLGHAELLAIAEGAKALGSWRLIDVTCYVTLEPCPMCAGALVLSRVGRVVYGCDDPKAGAVSSLYGIGSDARLNHRFEVERGVLGEACADQLRAFFAAIRAKKKAEPADGE
ncbi:MAG: tRNA adenosine(34) deaminase TadA [Polyangiales bacterium]